MKSIRARRGVLAAAVAAVAAAAGGIAYAAIPDAGGVYHACMLKNVGTIRIIDPDRQRCSAYLEVEISFAKEGPQGEPGPAGPPGPPGADGRDGEPFSGTFTSPNGVYALSVTDAGIVLSGNGSKIELSGTKIEARGAVALDLVAGGSVLLDAGATATLRAGGPFTIRGGNVALNPGASCQPAARIGDQITGSATPAGAVSGFVSTGSSAVCAG